MTPTAKQQIRYPLHLLSIIAFASVFDPGCGGANPAAPNRAAAPSATRSAASAAPRTAAKNIPGLSTPEALAATRTAGNSQIPIRPPTAGSAENTRVIGSDGGRGNI